MILFLLGISEMKQIIITDAILVDIIAFTVYIFVVEIAAQAALDYSLTQWDLQLRRDGFVQWSINGFPVVFRGEQASEFIIYRSQQTAELIRMVFYKFILTSFVTLVALRWLMILPYLIFVHFPHLIFVHFPQKVWASTKLTWRLRILRMEREKQMRMILKPRRYSSARGVY